MRRLVKQLFTGILLLAAQPLLGQSGENDRTVYLPLSNVMDAAGMATVITSKGRPADCIAPVAVTTIDGKKVVVPAKGFLIEPGTHSINGKATLDMTSCPLDDSNPDIGSMADLEVNFMPGNTYFIGFYHKPANTLEWKLVVWHVE